MRSALVRPGVRAGGGRASLTNLGVLVPYIDMPSSPAVGVQRSVRKSARDTPACNEQEMTAADGRFGQLALAHDTALALKLSPAASPCTRPPMASSLKKSKVGQRRWHRPEAVRSSPHAASPQPGDQPPCLQCLSMQTNMVCVGACVPAFVRVHAYARV